METSLATSAKDSITRNVRYWPKADIASCTDMSAFGGKADMPVCTAHVCF